MKSIVVLSCLLAVALAATVYEYENVEELIQNERLMNPYIDCFLDKGKCTPQAKNIKADIRKGVETGCADCTEQQKKDVATLTKHIIQKRPEVWKEMTDKYDPSGTYRAKYEEEAKKYGIVY